MPIRFSCPACFKTLSIGTRKAGAHIACPSCRGAIVVPAGSNVLWPPGGEPSPPRSDPEVVLAAAADAPVGLPACSPPAAPAAAPSRWRRLRVPALAAALLAAVAVPVAVARVASSREEPGPEPAPARPATSPETARRTPPAPAPTPAPAPDVAEAPTDEQNGPAAAPPAVAAALASEAGPPPLRGEATAARPAEPPTPQKRAELVAQRLRAKRRSHLTDEDLRRQLLLTPEARLDAVPGSSKSLLASSAKVAASGRDVVPAFVAGRLDLIGLRPRAGDDARMSREEALNLKVLSQHLRLHLETSMPGAAKGVVDLRPDPAILRERLLDNPLRDAWLRPQAISTLRQLLMHEHQHVRQILVEVLALIPGPRASLALAERAVFDLHPDVRGAAVAALSRRPAREYEDALVGGLRYPWPAVADHAAEALVALDLRDAVPKLIPLLDARDPDEPYAVEAGKKKMPVVAELVRLNHLRNCLLCHFPSFSPLDPVRGPVPNLSQPLPLPASGIRLAAGSGGGGWGGGGGSGGKGKFGSVSTFVRADITYLKQDFSVLQPVPNHGRLWPADQRFDYLVRLRPLAKPELLLLQDRPKEARPASPQREALLFALRELTGEDPGPTADDWKRLYSPITGRRLAQPLDPPEQVLHLRDALAEAPPARQAELLLLYKDRGGPAYDSALALVLPSLSSELQKAGRAALADRMYCLPVKDLRQRLGEKDPEMRRAAARACQLREERALVPELIDLLEDDSPEVARQAHLALRQISSRDFGPAPTAGLEQRWQATAAWLDWWEQQGQKRKGASAP